MSFMLGVIMTCTLVAAMLLFFVTKSGSATVRCGLKNSFKHNLYAIGLFAAGISVMAIVDSELAVIWGRSAMSDPADPSWLPWIGLDPADPNWLLWGGLAFCTLYVGGLVMCWNGRIGNAKGDDDHHDVRRIRRPGPGHGDFYYAIPKKQNTVLATWWVVMMALATIDLLIVLFVWEQPLMTIPCCAHLYLFWISCFTMLLSWCGAGWGLSTDRRLLGRAVATFSLLAGSWPAMSGDFRPYG